MEEHALKEEKVLSYAQEQLVVMNEAVLYRILRKRNRGSFRKLEKMIGLKKSHIERAYKHGNTITN
ncbi:hypothetical protein BUZ69_04590 [Staphylococcus saprophyticus]|uniref:hypothetical protein n=1 Tax=Staphylococcus saprophyticus TaxID=29385 RepID=UPI000D1EB3E3|nr:hypothetical protein [Staphylococcus saprophyticus]PTK47119.1 hypothetical protein BUZ69_04590 [Staphylococcus saprophyticus]